MKQKYKNLSKSEVTKCTSHDFKNKSIVIGYFNLLKLILDIYKNVITQTQAKLY